MKSIKLIYGDIIDKAAKDDIILQQVNCQGAYGAGLSGNISKAYSLVEIEYRDLCKLKKPNELLGTILETNQNERTIISIFGQLHYGRKFQVYTDYEALRTAFKHINTKYKGKNFIIPWEFGAGYANGSTKIIHDIIEEELVDCNIKWNIYRK